MGKVTTIALGIMCTFFLVGMLSTAMYDASEDTTKTQFKTYTEYKNLSSVGNLSGSNSQNSVSNMQAAAMNIAQKIADAQNAMNSDTLSDQILGAFGLLSALTIDGVILLFWILLDGVNFIAGIGFNLTVLPTPWNLFAVLIGFGVSLFVVYVVLKIASIALKVDI